MLMCGGKVIFGSDSSRGDVLRLIAVYDQPSHSVPGISVDHSVLLDAPLPSELIEDSEVEPTASQS